MQWAIANGLGLIPKDDLEACQNPRFGTSRGIIWMETSRPLHSRRILHAPGTIGVHSGVSPGENRTRALLSGAVHPTCPPRGLSMIEIK